MALPEFDPATLAIGTIGRPHGLAGDMTLRPHNNVGGAALESVSRVWLERASGDREEWRVDWFRRTGPGWMFRLRGIASRADAEKLTNAIVRIDRQWLPPLAAGEFFVQDLLGCVVQTESGQVLGRVEGLLWNGAQDIMVIPGDEEVLIPVVPEFMRDVDLPGRRITVAWVLGDSESESAAEGASAGKATRKPRDPDASDA